MRCNLFVGGVVIVLAGSVALVPESTASDPELQKETFPSDIGAIDNSFSDSSIAGGLARLLNV